MRLLTLSLCGSEAALGHRAHILRSLSAFGCCGVKNRMNSGFGSWQEMNRQSTNFTCIVHLFLKHDGYEL